MEIVNNKWIISELRPNLLLRLSGDTWSLYTCTLCTCECVHCTHATFLICIYQQFILEYYHTYL